MSDCSPFHLLLPGVRVRGREDHSLFFLPKENLILSSPNPWEGGLSRGGTAGPRESGQKEQHSGTSLRSSDYNSTFQGRGRGFSHAGGTRSHMPWGLAKHFFEKKKKEGTVRSLRVQNETEGRVSGPQVTAASHGGGCPPPSSPAPRLPSPLCSLLTSPCLAFPSGLCPGSLDLNSTELRF